MVTLERGFEDDLRGALLDELEQKAQDEIAPELKQRITDLLEAYGSRHDYDVRALIAGLQVDVVRDGGGVEVVARLPNPAYLFETGTVGHEVHANGDGVLSFIWEERHDPPEWVQEEYEREGDGWRVFLPSVQVSGLPEGRFIRDALDEIRRWLP